MAEIIFESLSSSVTNSSSPSLPFFPLSFFRRFFGLSSPSSLSAASSFWMAAASSLSAPSPSISWNSLKYRSISRFATAPSFELSTIWLNVMTA